MTRRYAAKTDANQAELVAVLRKLGFSVYSTHKVGSGFPDLVCGKYGFNLLCEVKDGKNPPSKRALTPDEQEFHSTWRGTVFILESTKDCEKLAAYALALYERTYRRTYESN